METVHDLLKFIIKVEYESLIERMRDESLVKASDSTQLQFKIIFDDEKEQVTINTDVIAIPLAKVKDIKIFMREDLRKLFG